jgi:hypothetical protein
MAKLAGTAWKPGPNPKKTSQGSNSSRIKRSSMNKSKKRSFKAYKGQG